MLHLRLAELRKKRGLTQAEIAKFLRITPQAYSLYETNKNNINNETLCMLADFFEVSTDYLLGRQDLIPSFLSEEERNVIEKYRALDERAKSGIKNTLDFEYTRSLKTNRAKKSAKSS
ncbi:MAG: helix-turn-helix transcriptional regulator [Oscillospiraceae bacterium]|nr:helix-turn-helix transcriptional regulator [Oscillospiraceae bacterium]